MITSAIAALSNELPSSSVWSEDDGKLKEREAEQIEYHTTVLSHHGAMPPSLWLELFTADDRLQLVLREASTVIWRATIAATSVGDYGAHDDELPSNDRFSDKVSCKRCNYARSCTLAITFIWIRNVCTNLVASASSRRHVSLRVCGTENLFPHCPKSPFPVIYLCLVADAHWPTQRFCDFLWNTRNVTALAIISHGWYNPAQFNKQNHIQSMRDSGYYSTTTIVKFDRASAQPAAPEAAPPADRWSWVNSRIVQAYVNHSDHAWPALDTTGFHGRQAGGLIGRSWACEMMAWTSSSLDRTNKQTKRTTVSRTRPVCRQVTVLIAGTGQTMWDGTGRAVCDNRQ